MYHLYRLVLIFSLVCAGVLLAGERPAAARLRPVEARGTVYSFDSGSGILEVNTRLGLRRFQLTPTTLILLNNRGGDTLDIVFGLEARLNFEYETSIVHTLRLFRQIRRTGTVGAVTNNTLELRLADGAVLPLRLDGASVTTLMGIPVTDRRILSGLRARAVFDPVSLQLNTLEASARRTRGTIAEVDVAARLVTLAGRAPLTVTVDPFATVRRGGAAVPLSQLAAGDRVVVIHLPDGTAVRALAIEARPAATR